MMDLVCSSVRFWVNNLRRKCHLPKVVKIPKGYFAVFRLLIINCSVKQNFGSKNGSFIVCHFLCVFFRVIMKWKTIFVPSSKHIQILNCVWHFSLCKICAQNLSSSNLFQLITTAGHYFESCPVTLNC